METEVTSDQPEKLEEEVNQDHQVQGDHWDLRVKGVPRVTEVCQGQMALLGSWDRLETEGALENQETRAHRETLAKLELKVCLGYVVLPADRGFSDPREILDNRAVKGKMARKENKASRVFQDFQDTKAHQVRLEHRVSQGKMETKA